jgi:Sulfotransferase family
MAGLRLEYGGNRQGHMLPNFLIIGAAKAGTSSLYRYLGQHPGVFMSPWKEPNFFSYEGKEIEIGGPLDDDYITDIETYSRLFDGVTTEVAVGEASVACLHRAEAPAHIRDRVPDAKLIAVLRDPVDRAYSSFLHLRREGKEPLGDFLRAVDAEESRMRANWNPLYYYTRLGLYSTQLKRYFDQFPREQIRVYLYEDLCTNPLAMMRDMFSYLGVDDRFAPDMSARYNVSMLHRSRRLYEFLRDPPHRVRSLARVLLPASVRRQTYLRLHRRNTVPAPPLAAEHRARLLPRFEREVLELQSLIRRDLSAWLVERPELPERGRS